MWWGGAGFCRRDTGPGEKQKLGADTEGESTDELDTGSRKGMKGGRSGFCQITACGCSWAPGPLRVRD